MKTGIFAISVMIIVAISVTLNSIFLHKAITGFIEDASALDVNVSSAYEEANTIRDRFSDKEHFVSLSVNHEDLTNIEEFYAELIGYLKVDMTDEAEVTKSRLLDALTHLRRLSGVNIDSII